MKPPVMAATICAVLLGVFALDKYVPARAQAPQAEATSTPSPRPTPVVYGQSIRYVAPIPVMPGETSPNTIVTTGRGSVRIPADRLRFEVRLFARQNSGASLDDAGKAVAAALVQNGIADARWVIPLNSFSSQGTTPLVSGTLAHPTRSDIESKVRATLRDVPDSVATAIANYQVTSTFEADDCSAAEARAIRAALDEARRRAEATADAAGLHLGSVVSVNATQITGSGCPSKPDGEIFGGIGPSDNATGDPSVTVNATATVMFSAR